MAKGKSNPIAAFFVWVVIAFLVVKCVATPSETPAQKQAKAVQKAQDDVYWLAVTRCQSLVKLEAVFPTKADFNWDVKGSYGERVVAGRVDLMNRMGAMIPHKYYCSFDDNGFVKEHTVIEG